MDKRFKSRTFEEVLISSVKRLATRIFAEAQKTVPVDTGALRDSGSIKHPGAMNRMSVITYDVPYAQMINQTQGASSGKMPGGKQDKTMTVRKHKRKYPNGKTVTVRKHEKKVGPRAAGQGNGFLNKAVRKKLASFSNDTFPNKVIIVKGLGF
jgi:hypothetical protein